MDLESLKAKRDARIKAKKETIKLASGNSDTPAEANAIPGETKK